MSETDYCGTRDKTASEQETEYGFNVLKRCLRHFINVLCGVYLEFMMFCSKAAQLAKKTKDRERQRELYGQRSSCSMGRLPDLPFQKMKWEPTAAAKAETQPVLPLVWYTIQNPVKWPWQRSQAWCYLKAFPFSSENFQIGRFTVSGGDEGSDGDQKNVFQEIIALRFGCY